MGSGIVEVIARSGYSVIGVDLAQKDTSYADLRIANSIGRGVAGSKITESEGQAILSRIELTTDLTEVASCQLVIEAITEDLLTKSELFADLDSILGPDAIMATNTSSLSVTEISVATSRPSRVIGLHFFNPAMVQKFIEIVGTVTTDQDVIDAGMEFARSVGKEPVLVSDRAGFIANSLLFGYLNQAVAMYEQKYASREDIDSAMRFGCGLPMGPLALLDLIGLDTSLQILDTMYRESRDRLHAPSALLKQLVAAGRMGRKSGEGFYSYAEPNVPTVVADSRTPVSSESSADSGITRVAVIGSGTMATGIVSVLAAGGVSAIALTRSEQRSTQLRESLEKSWSKLVEKGRITREQKDEYLARVQTCVSAEELVGRVDLVIEAIAEELGPKCEIFSQLDKLLPADVIFATTTSSLSVIEIAASTSRMEQFIGIHFFNPAPIMPLVEIVSTVATDSEVVIRCTNLIHQLGKKPVQCSDRAGFIVNALLFPYLNNAIAMASANYASIEDIDTAMKLGCGYPMGPFELLDVVGLDVSLAIINTLYREFREPGFAPQAQLEHLVTAGFVGRKVGRGFRKY
ncbi:MAG: 3-hydroxyacyl-CoA dehydrogenase family protein [Actinobacteria bacterium]|jgi:3-hydroxybutyryl-CoA dehydrogenase|nr:3-hydroxyacyl-CoA dehydrogenase family protein [Actinomycetota bacterium]MBT5501532.1 3-hydroxyacyl-CoA dehydrogenase family protein [Actinomycetota bacterium]MBT5805895.1 3-hydroxyacyl-CoA dehydrogenase family protein [Actinomycetota bacterium]HBK38906.1 3-hydroxybutyryl-CoA dehydrogenase [Actinomycetota bacterium]